MPSTVLLVEDDDDIREDLAALIEDRGYRVVTAVNGSEALDKLSSMPLPSLILLDLMMPVMDGWQLRAALLERPKLASIPVVLLSGVADLEAQAQSLDAVAYLRKPIALDEVYRAIESHCS